MSNTVVIKAYESKNIHAQSDVLSNKIFCNDKVTTTRELSIMHEKDIVMKIRKTRYGNYESYRRYSSNHNKFFVYNDAKNAQDLMDIANSFDFNENIFSLRESMDSSKYDYIIYSGSNDVEFKIYNAEITSIDEEFIDPEGNKQNLHLLTGTLEITVNVLVCNECNEERINTYEPTTQLLGEYFYNNENHIKLTKIYKQISYTHTNDSIAWYRIYKNMIIYNKTTHRLYKISNHHMRGSSYLKNKHKKSIKDVTYHCSIFDYHNISVNNGTKLFYAHMLNNIMKDFKQVYEYTKSDLEHFADLDEKGCISNIDLIRRCVLLKNHYNIKNTKLAAVLLEIRKYDKDLSTKMSGKTEKEMLNLIKLSKKALASINIENISMMYMASYNYIDNKDYINKMLDDKYYGSYFVIEKTKKCNFIHQFSKHNTEERLVNQIIKRKNYIRDTNDMFIKIIKANPEYSIDFSLDIKQIHDILSKDLSKYKDKNRKISKNKDLYKVFKGFTSCGIEYRLARDTDELIDVGSFMNICVGSYGKRAVAKSVFIIVGYNSDNEPVTCIEINKVDNTRVLTASDTNVSYKYRVNQVKKKYNRKACEIEKTDLISLFKENNIYYDCYDLDIEYSNPSSVPIAVPGIAEDALPPIAIPALVDDVV